MMCGGNMRTVVTMLLLTACAAVLAAGREELGTEQVRYLLFENGTVLCRVVQPVEPEPEEKQAAAELSASLGKIGNVNVPVVADPAPAFDGVSLHVGRTTLARSINPVPADLDADGFVIVPVDAKTILLLGGRSVSTFYAVTEFLERYAGMLWVWPAEHGTVTPSMSRLEAAVRRQVSEPAFRARKFSGMKGTPMHYYRIHLGARETRSEFHHNVWKVLNAQRYWDEHPEYFAAATGDRRKPASHNSNWQACTTNPEVIAVFADAARKQFARFPWNISFSVSQNDGGGFCTCSRCGALDVPEVEGISDRYFTFLNAVADQVRESHPDKYICCLGYGRATRNVPSRVTLRPNTMIYAVIPTLEHHHETVEAWSKVAPALGVYFWMHGKAIPKFYPHRFAEYLRFLREHHVQGVYAEVYQDNPERMSSFDLDGPRVWFMGKLLWNPDADIDALLERFCSRFYGAAKEPMLRYYQRCEHAWERREDPFDFGREWRELELETYSGEDMDVMAGCIAEALALADSEAVTGRLEKLRVAFTKVASWVRLLDLPSALEAMPIRDQDTAAAVLRAVHEAESRSREMAAKGLSLCGAMPDSCEAGIDARFAAISAVLGQDAVSFWRRERDRLPEIARFIDTQLIDLAGVVENVISNPGLETARPHQSAAAPELNWTTLDAPGWDKWLRPGTRGRVGVVPDAARSGKRSLMLVGCEAACGIRTIPVKLGQRYRVSCWARTNAPVTGAERPTWAGRLTLKWQTPDGKWQDPPPPLVVGLPAGAAEWTPLSATVTIAPGVGRLVALLGAHNQKPDEKVWFDDCVVQLLHDPE